MFSTIREVFAFTKGETIALCILLAVTLAGGGLVIYDNSRQGLPPALFFEPAATTPARAEAPKSANTAVVPATTPSLATVQRPLQLNVNTAPAESLQLLPFIGESLSRRIVAYREKNGPFDSLGQLIAVNGIGPKNLQRIRPYLICQ